MSSPGSLRSVAAAILAAPLILAFVLATSGCGGGGQAASPSSSPNPVPSISSLSPSTGMVGATSQTLAINGSNFLASSTVTYNGVAHGATFVSASQLTITLSASDQATGGLYPVVVTNPQQGGGASNPVNFTVDNSAPTITSLSPSSAIAGAAAQTLTINGRGFVANSAVTYNGATHTTMFLSSTELTVSLSAGDQTTAGNFPVVVTNPSPGGGTSNPVNFAVSPENSLNVTIIGLSPGTNANVTIIGPSGYSQSLTQTTTLAGLNPGTYAISGAIVQAISPANVVDIPSANPAIVDITATSAAVSTVSYQSLSTVWQAIGPIDIPVGTGGAAGAGKLQAFAVSNTNSSLMYAAGGIGPGNSGPYTEAGVYKTIDGGNVWMQMNSGLSDPAVDALWLDQSNPNNIVAGSYSTGIFRSTDGGASWAVTGNLGSTSAFLQVSSTLYAATSQGIAASSDGGATWSLIKSTPVAVRALAGEGGAIYAGLENGEVLIQANPSAAWISVSPANSSGNTVWSVAVNPTNSQNAVVVEWNNYFAEDLYMTKDGGATWAIVTVGSFSCPAQVVAFDPAGATLYAGCDGSLWATSNGGNTWSQLASGWDVRLIVPAAGGVPGNILLGSDQGLYLSKNGGNRWQSLNGNIASSILYGLDVNGLTILTAVQDYSPISSFDGGTTWQQLQGPSPPVGEAGAVIFNPGNPRYAYFFTLGGFQYSSDGGQTFHSAQGLPAFNNGDDDLIAVDRTNPSTVYVAAKDGVYKSVDLGVSWTRQSAWPLSQPMMVAVSPVDGNTIFVGTFGSGGLGSLLVTHDGGTTWATSGLAASCGFPSSVAVEPSNPQIILLGMSRPAPCGGLLRSTDGGANFGSVNTGVENRPTQVAGCFAPTHPHVAYDPSGSGVVAAAANSGLYLSSDQGSNWANIRGNAVPYVFTQPVWSGGFLYASTCGEGVLRMPFAF